MPLPAALTPFAFRAFAWLWLANFVSGIGRWLQDTAAAWMMTEMSGSPLMVSLVQAAAQAPVVLLAVPAGALADIVDRRHYLVLTNSWMLAVSAVLAVLAILGLVGPWTLLALTALLACGAGMNNPAWSAAVPLTVPRAELSQALVMNSIGFNLARAAGPALGGVVVVAAGAGIAFAANAASFAVVAVIVGLLISLPCVASLGGAPPERVAGAMRAGLSYAAAEPVVRRTLVRSAEYYGFASAIWALLPLYVSQTLGLGASAYGVLLGLIGVGAMLGGLAMPHLRARVPRDALITSAGLVTGLALLPPVLLPAFWSAAAGMVLYGVGWILGASNLQTTVQLASAPWVRARTLSIYQAVFNGGMGLGAVGWGWLGEHAGVPGTLLASALGSVVAAVLGRMSSLPAEVPDPSLPALGLHPNLAISDAISPLLEQAAHPVLVSITWRIALEDAGAFRAAMDEVALARRRDGATRWLLSRDIEQPEYWVEAFRLPDWHETLRAVARMNLVDAEAIAAARKFHRGERPPELRVLIAERT
ncbi:MAG: MFS transporter [Acetobacteraceae bacterium]|nr:MFS transporter [Acetobacteraceae bacterium]